MPPGEWVRLLNESESDRKERARHRKRGIDWLRALSTARGRGREPAAPGYLAKKRGAATDPGGEARGRHVRAFDAQRRARGHRQGDRRDRGRNLWRDPPRTRQRGAVQVAIL